MRTTAAVMFSALTAIAGDLPAAEPIPSIAANVLIVKSHADIEKWVLLDPAKRGKTGRMRSVTRGTKVFLPVIATFSQSQVGKDIALRGVVQVVSPKGDTVVTFKCLANQVDPRAPKTIVLAPVLGVTFDASDPSGEYRVRAGIKQDGKTVVVDETLRLQ